MFSKPIELAISSAGADVITNVFVVFMLLVFTAACVVQVSGKGDRFVEYAPSLLTTLGIFGTFCGIVAGLLAFSVSAIDTSIDLLLSGMKTAFTTSLVGMFLSILFKLLVTVGILKRQDSHRYRAGAVGIKDLLKSMEEHRHTTEAVYGAIGGNDQSSLISQIERMRNENSDNFHWQRRHVEKADGFAELHLQLQRKNDDRADQIFQRQIETWRKQEEDASKIQQQLHEFQTKLLNKFDHLAEVLSKSATEHVIEALQKVILEFNEKLTEQFGENFKQLNSAVLELVTWQENYKVQLGQMHEQYSLGVNAISSSAESVRAIEQNSQAIPVTMEALGAVLQKNQRQINELGGHLDAFVQMRDKAVEAVPQIQSVINETLSGIKEGSETLIGSVRESNRSIESAVMLTSSSFTNMVNDMSEESKNISASLRSGSETIVEQTNRSKEAFDSSLQGMREQLERSLQEMARKQTEEAGQIFEGLRKSIENALGDTGEAVEKQVTLLDKSLEAELNKVMSELGRALASISGQFTKDYQELVRAMRVITKTGH